MKVLYKKNYIQRDLYVIKYKDKYLMVYRSSGLNTGRKGRILPFAMLAEPARATLSSETPGYIYKKFYFKGMYINHYKNPQEMQPYISDFLIGLEKYLVKYPTTPINYDHIQSYKELLPIAREINKELLEAIKDIEPFDWDTLSNKDTFDVLGTSIGSIEPINNYMESNNAI